MNRKKRLKAEKLAKNPPPRTRHDFPSLDSHPPIPPKNEGLSMDITLGLTQETIDKIFKECDLDVESRKRQRDFVLYLFECDYNASEAIRRAGYEGPHAAQTAREYMRKTRVRNAIALFAEEISKFNRVRYDYVLSKMLKGVETAEEAGNLTAMARFVEMIGKHLGMFKEQVELSGKDGKAIEIEQRTKDDVESFKSSIDGLVKRGGERGTSLETKH